MLQRSLSASSLLKQAAAAIAAQQSENPTAGRPLIGARAQSDFVSFPFSSRRLSQENTSTLTSISSSGLASPGTGERKHIHFDERVSQCIALEVKGEDDDEPDTYINSDYDSDSDDGAIMMKRSNSKRKLPPIRRAPVRTNTAETKTIAALPSTTLKYREDTPEPQETAMKHSSNGFWSPSRLSPSPSQETLRPSKPSSRTILLGDDDDDDDLDWTPPPSAFANRKDSVSVTQERLSNLHTSSSSTSLNSLAGGSFGMAERNNSGTFGAEGSGMRRTESGMFMPYEEDEDDLVSEGLFGKVVDTVNTARDIAHVIWNVGWRR
jgi:hypothetical protein